MLGKSTNGFPYVMYPWRNITHVQSLQTCGGGHADIYKNIITNHQSEILHSLIFNEVILIDLLYLPDLNFTLVSSSQEDILISKFACSLFHIAGNPWAAADGWDTLHPQLNLNLDDDTPYVLHNGSLHVETEVSRSSQLEDLRRGRAQPRYNFFHFHAVFDKSNRFCPKTQGLVASPPGWGIRHW